MWGKSQQLETIQAAQINDAQRNNGKYYEIIYYLFMRNQQVGRQTPYACINNNS